MTTPRIFISHSHHDNAFGLQIVQELRALLGEDGVWFDASGGLHGGDEWWRTIVTEITDRPIFIVILSPDALASRWVPREMDIAYRLHVELGHRLIPIMLKPCQRRADWALIQDINFVAPRTHGEAFAELCAVLGISASAPTAPAPEQRSPVTQRLSREVQRAFGQEDWSVVIDKTDVLLARNEMTPLLWQERGLALLAQHDAQNALAALQRALAADPDDVPTLRATARAQTMLGDDAAAAQTLTLAQSLAPLEDAAMRLPLLEDLVAALQRLKRWPDAERRVNDALRLAPRDPAWLARQRDLALRPIVEQYNAAVQARTWPTALSACDAALAKYPGDVDWQNRRAQMQTQIESDRRAAIEAERLRKEREQREAQERREKLVPQRLRTLGFTLAPNADVIIPPTVEVPAGTFTMGSDKRRDRQAQDDELQVQVNLAAFRIGTFPVTVAEYACALAAKARGATEAKDIAEPGNWAQQQQKPDHLVVYVSWLQAIAYADWLSKVTSQPWRLPSEAEWEKAARGTDGRIYPWGDQWDKTRANTSDGGVSGTSEVGRYRRNGPGDPASDVSPYGASDMAGNVWEWTSSIYQQHYDPQSSDNMSDRTDFRVLRGGSWRNEPQYARAAQRNRYQIDNSNGNVGFRLVLARVGAGSH
jgi:formylglycine-generating enzyme required for sulfatase activity